MRVGGARLRMVLRPSSSVQRRSPCCGREARLRRRGPGPESWIPSAAAHCLTDAFGGVVLALSWLLVTYHVVRPDYW